MQVKKTRRDSSLFFTFENLLARFDGFHFPEKNCVVNDTDVMASFRTTPMTSAGEPTDETGPGTEATTFYSVSIPSEEV